MPTETLQFESARVVQSLHANDPRLLKAMESQLAVKITTRDGWVRLEGGESGVATAAVVFRELDEARRHGLDIHAHEFQYALRTSREARGERLSDLCHARIDCSPGRPPVTPRNHAQRGYVEQIRANDIVFGVGPAGTGKTYLAMAMAVEALKRGKVSRIILTRPAVEAGEALGFLPGDLHEKIFPYLRPLYDALYDMLEPDEMQRLVEKGVVEIAPLAYMRGRTLNHAFIILDEAQNTTVEQMFMFLTRLGGESRCVVTGDYTQIDLPPSKKSGLIEALDALKGVQGIAFVHFIEKDVIRHELVQSIIEAYKSHRDQKAARAGEPEGDAGRRKLPATGTGHV